MQNILLTFHNRYPYAMNACSKNVRSLKFQSLAIVWLFIIFFLLFKWCEYLKWNSSSKCHFSGNSMISSAQNFFDFGKKSDLSIFGVSAITQYHMFKRVLATTEIMDSSKLSNQPINFWWVIKDVCDQLFSLKKITSFPLTNSYYFFLLHSYIKVIIPPGFTRIILFCSTLPSVSPCMWRSFTSDNYFLFDGPKLNPRFYSISLMIFRWYLWFYAWGIIISSFFEKSVLFICLLEKYQTVTLLKPS